MGEFVPLAKVVLTRKAKDQHPEQAEWRSHKVIAEKKEPTPITCLNFAPPRPSSKQPGELLAVTHGARVDLVQTSDIAHFGTYSKFKGGARCASFRLDGRLLVVSDDTSLVQVVQVETRSRLRRLKGHSGPVYCCAFSSNNTHVCSAGDDKTAKLWDVSEGSCVVSHSAHDDFIRSLVQSPDTSAGVWATGSYDGRVRLLDFRLPPREQMNMLKVNHMNPVESLCFIPSSNILVAAGGTEVKLWDMKAGAKLINKFKIHTKTVTGVCVSRDQNHILTTSLDQTTKVVDFQNDAVVNTFRLPQPGVKIASHPNANAFAVGMADGSWLVRRKEAREPQRTKRKAEDTPDAITHDGETARKEGRTGATDVFDVDGFVTHDKVSALVRKFQYQEALNVALTMGGDVVLSLVTELAHRGALSVAMRGRTPASLVPLVRAFTRMLGSDPSVTLIVCECLQSLLASNQWLHESYDPAAFKALKMIQLGLENEVSNVDHLNGISGLVEMVMD